MFGTLSFIGLFVLGAWLNPRGETKVVRRMFGRPDVEEVSAGLLIDR